MIIAVIFVEDQPGIDISDVAGDVDFLGKDEDLREIVHGVVGFVSDINIAIDGESAVHEHSKGVHKFLASGIASRDEVAAAIELVEIGGAVHGAEAGVPLVVELGEAEIILGGSFIRGETGDGIGRIPDDSIAEAGLETGENSGADAGDIRITRSVFIVSNSNVTNIANARNY